MEEGSRAVLLGTLIAPMVEEGEDWKTLEIPPPGAAVPTQAPPPAAAAPPPPMACSAPPPPLPRVAPTGLDDLNLLKKFPDSKAAPVTIVPAMAVPSPMATPALAQIPPGSRPMYPPQSIPCKPGAPCTYTEITASNVRRVIDQRLTQSKTTIPHAYTTVDCDLRAILQLRKEMAKGEDLPEVNVTWSEEGPQALDSNSISIAVATEKGLITPIITNAADKGVQEISANAKALAQNAWDGKLLPHEYQGGSYSISNLGVFGISGFSAVINPPQVYILVYILAVVTSRSVLRLTEETGALSTVTLSSDGYLVDDELASCFLDKFCANLERPQRMSLA